MSEHLITQSKVHKRSTGTVGGAPRVVVGGGRSLQPEVTDALGIVNGVGMLEPLKDVGDRSCLGEPTAEGRGPREDACA